MIPNYLPKHYIAQKMGITGAHLSLKLHRNRGERITPSDKKKIAEVFGEIIMDLENRITVLKGS